MVFCLVGTTQRVCWQTKHKLEEISDAPEWYLLTPFAVHECVLLMQFPQREPRIRVKPDRNDDFLKLCLLLSTHTWTTRIRAGGPVASVSMGNNSPWTLYHTTRARKGLNTPPVHYGAVKTIHYTNKWYTLKWQNELDTMPTCCNWSLSQR